MADTLVLGTSTERCASSSLAWGTKNTRAGLRREVIRLLYTESDDSSSLSPGTKFIRRLGKSGIRYAFELISYK